LGEVKAVDVEDWLGNLDLASGSKKKLRDIMHLLYVRIPGKAIRVPA
jgi:hypothetical protein